jgi:Bacterial protein of unknown function (DUF899)
LAAPGCDRLVELDHRCNLGDALGHSLSQRIGKLADPWR